MSIFSNPFDAKSSLRCSCGQHASQAEHEALSAHAEQLAGEHLSSHVVEQAVVRALFPQDSVRRKFLQAVGSPVAMSAISSIFPSSMSASSRLPVRLRSSWPIPWAFIESRGLMSIS
jgi:nitrate/nitrite transport system substrate-binding protein